MKKHRKGAIKVGFLCLTAVITRRGEYYNHGVDHLVMRSVSEGKHAKRSGKVQPNNTIPDEII